MPADDRQTEAELACNIAATTGAFGRAEVLASSYADLHDWRTKVESLRDRTKAAQESRVVDLSTFQDIKLASEGLDMQIEEFDLAMGKLATWDAVQTQEIEALRTGFKSLRVAVDLLHDVLKDEPT